MGITGNGYDLLKIADEKLGYFPYRMLELGNQFIFFTGDPLHPYGSPAKKFFEDQGITHVSVDINGKDGALPYDLSKPIECSEEPFDIVTDYGVIEHVKDNLYYPFKFVHDYCKVGGYMIHSLPYTKNWPDHKSFWWFTEYSFEDLARICGYEIVYMDTFFACGNTTSGKEVRYILKKLESSVFPEEQDFSIKVYKE